jgi:hypothetical protein
VAQLDLTLEPTPTGLEDAQGSAIGTVDQVGDAVTNGLYAQTDHPKVSGRDSQEQATEPVRMLEARRIEAKTSFFAVTKQRLGPESQLIGLARGPTW